MKKEFKKSCRKNRKAQKKIIKLIKKLEKSGGFLPLCGCTVNFIEINVSQK